MYIYTYIHTYKVMDDAALPSAGQMNTSNGDDSEAPPSPKDMDFLLGLDMLKRFNCSIDLMDSKLKFRLGSTILETPFLHEKDLDASKGGTKGFNATLANEELIEAQRRYDAKKDDSSNNNKGGDNDTMEE